MTRIIIPETMKAVLQDEPGGQLYVSEIPVPRPRQGEVLIRMYASPLNPSDLSQLQGTFNIRTSYPFTPGIEGSGTVIEAGKGLLPGLRLGKRVSCSSSPGNSGTWSEYMVTSAMKCVPLDKQVTLEQGSMMLVNPLTAIALVDIARMNGHKAIVNNASASALGRMLINLCRKYNIPLINIVRKQDQVDMLLDSGAGLVLNSEAAGFKDNLKEHCDALGATLLLDAIGGEQTAIFAQAAPEKSTIMVYAKLSEKEFCIDPRIILQGDKRIEGFSLPVWNNKRSILQKLRSIKKAQSLIGRELNTAVRSKFRLDEANKAIDTYRSEMSGGKILLLLEPLNE